MRRKVFANVTRESTPVYIHAALLHALTEYDRREAAKPRNGHNPYALAHYMKGLHEVDAMLADDVPLRKALVNQFCGRLLDYLLRAVHEVKATHEEQNADRW